MSEALSLTDPTNPRPTLIDIVALNRSFGRGETVSHVLRDLSLRIDAGSFTVIRGPSGAGKTTLLRILGMLDQSYSGSYEFAGVDVGQIGVGGLDGLRTASVGFVFQEGRFLDHLTVGENIALPLRLRGEHQSVIRARLDEAASLLFRPEERASGLLDLRPAQASGGQRQRAALARAIVTRPQLILADEPTASLDPVSRRHVVEKLHELHQRGATVVVVSHDPVFFDYGDQYDLRDGRLFSVASAEAEISVPMPFAGVRGAVGWLPQLGVARLVQEALVSLVRRPLLSLLTLLSLVAGIVQVAVLASLLGGVDRIIEQAVTDGSRLTRITVRPRTADLQNDDRFPLNAAILAQPLVLETVARRSTSFAVVTQNGSETPYPTIGLHPNDPELRQFHFLAGASDALAADDFGIVATPGFLTEVLSLDSVDGTGIIWADVIGQHIGVVVPRFDGTGQRTGVEPLTLRVAGVILAGEGARQFYVSNRLLVATDAIKRDRTNTLALPLTADATAWIEGADLSPLLDWSWEDMLHVYVTDLDSVLPTVTALVGLGYRPEAEIWDYLWILDLKQAVLHIFLPMLGLLVLVIGLVLIGNVYISARLREGELALCRVLGMGRGDLLAIEVLSLVLLTFVAVGIGLAGAQGLIDLLAAQFRAQAQLLAGVPEASMSRMTDNLFSPVTDVALPIALSALALVTVSVVFPSVRVANTDPAKVFSRP